MSPLKEDVRFDSFDRVQVRTPSRNAAGDSIGDRLLLAPRVRAYFQSFASHVDWQPFLSRTHALVANWCVNLANAEVPGVARQAVVDAATTRSLRRRLNAQVVAKECNAWLPWGVHRTVLESLFRGGSSAVDQSAVLATSPLLWYHGRNELHANWATLCSSSGEGWRTLVGRNSSFQHAIGQAMDCLRNIQHRHRERAPDGAELRLIPHEIFESFKRAIQARGETSAALRHLLEHCLSALDAQSQTAAACREPRAAGEPSHATLGDDMPFVLAQRAELQALRADIAMAVFSSLRGHLRRVAIGQTLDGRSLASLARDAGLKDGTLRRYAHEMRRYFNTTDFAMHLQAVAKSYGRTTDELIDVINGRAGGPFAVRTA